VARGRRRQLPPTHTAAPVMLSSLTERAGPRRPTYTRGHCAALLLRYIGVASAARPARWQRDATSPDRRYDRAVVVVSTSPGEASLRQFGELEAVIMDRLWARQRPTLVREILDELTPERPLAYTTVLSVMDKLHRKGWLHREPDGRAYRYVPVQTRDAYSATLMRVPEQHPSAARQRATRGPDLPRQSRRDLPRRHLRRRPDVARPQAGRPGRADPHLGLGVPGWPRLRSQACHPDGESFRSSPCNGLTCRYDRVAALHTGALAADFDALRTAMTDGIEALQGEQPPSRRVDPEVSATLIMAGFDGLIIQWLLDPTRLPTGAAIAETLQRAADLQPFTTEALDATGTRSG